MLERIRCTVPEGLEPGATVCARAQSGTLVQARLSPDLRPGSVFYIDVPAPHDDTYVVARVEDRHRGSSSIDIGPTPTSSEQPASDTEDETAAVVAAHDSDSEQEALAHEHSDNADGEAQARLDRAMQLSEETHQAEEERRVCGSGAWKRMLKRRS